MDNRPTLEELTGEEINSLLTEVEITTPDGEVKNLAEVGVEIVTAHDELTQFKQGALAMVQALDEAMIEWETQGNTDAVEAIEEIKHAGYAVYLRLERGDAELIGDRDGTFSDYFESENDDSGGAEAN